MHCHQIAASIGCEVPVRFLHFPVSCISALLNCKIDSVMCMHYFCHSRMVATLQLSNHRSGRMGILK